MKQIFSAASVLMLVLGLVLLAFGCKPQGAPGARSSDLEVKYVTSQGHRFWADKFEFDGCEFILVRSSVGITAFHHPACKCRQEPDVELLIDGFDPIKLDAD